MLVVGVLVVGRVTMGKTLVEKPNVVPVPSDVKRVVTFSKVLRTIVRRTGDTGRRRRGAALADSTVHDQIAARVRKAVAPVAPSLVTVEHEGGGSAGAEIGGGDAAFSPRFPAPFLDVWDPTETGWGQCFGCEEPVYIPDAQVVVRMGGVSIMWHRACREKALWQTTL